MPSWVGLFGVAGQIDGFLGGIAAGTGDDWNAFIDMLNGDTDEILVFFYRDR